MVGGVSSRPVLWAALLMVVASAVLQGLSRLAWLAISPVLGLGLAGVMLSVALPFLLGTALGGVVAVRRWAITWRQLTAAAVLNALATLAVVWLAVPGLSPGRLGDYPGVWWDQVKAALPILSLASAGVFALPLLDPAVRRTGPTPTVWKVMLTAVAVLGLLVVALTLHSRPDPGLAFLILGAFFGAVLAGLGLLLSLGGATRAGAWTGALGLVMGLLGITVWVLTGQAWFP